MHRWFHNGIMYSLESNYLNIYMEFMYIALPPDVKLSNHYTTFDLLKLPTSGDIKNLVHDIRSAKQKFKCDLLYYHMTYVRQKKNSISEQ
jgi:hypothetical protein